MYAQDDRDGDTRRCPTKEELLQMCPIGCITITRESFPCPMCIETDECRSKQSRYTSNHPFNIFVKKMQIWLMSADQVGLDAVKTKFAWQLENQDDTFAITVCYAYS